VDHRDHADHQQAGDQEPDPHEHDLFDQGYVSSNPAAEEILYHNAMTGPAPPARPMVNVNRRAASA
jgi:hypothetical protein